MLLLLLIVSFQAWSFDHEHEAFHENLRNNLKRNGNQTFLDYKKIKENPESLNRYIDGLSNVTEEEYGKWSEKQKLATLINAYNAWTTKLIIENYPISSIKKIGPFYSTPWKKDFINWLGKKVNLDHVEHDVIRRNFKEPRIHFALVCAAIGCPSLQDRPFVASKLDDQLQKATLDFLQDQNKNRAIASGNELRLHVSSIFKWYKEDFGNSEKQLIAFILEAMGISNTVSGKKVKLVYEDYDWSLNDWK